MNYDTVVTLIHEVPDGTDASGNAQFITLRRYVYAEKKAVRQSEFFQAAALGFKPEIVLEVHSFEYQNEELCELEGERYRIYRVYPLGKSERSELYLTAIAGDTNAFT